MPVYLFTYHAYRSWSPRHPRGFVRSAEQGIEQPNDRLAQAYDDAAKHPPVLFDGNVQRFLIETVLDICMHRDWRAHGVATEPTHLHLLVSWQSALTWDDVRGKVKNVLSTSLSKRSGMLGRPWFVDQASRKHVRDAGHFDYLMMHYLPKHAGVKWFEDERGWC